MKAAIIAALAVLSLGASAEQEWPACVCAPLPAAKEQADAAALRAKLEAAIAAYEAACKPEAIRARVERMLQWVTP